VEIENGRGDRDEAERRLKAWIREKMRNPDPATHRR
jgi:hypothetical protein